MTVQLSRNEIRAEVEKAIRGAGFDWGRAKDGGIMAAYLAGHGLPFLGTVTRCLDLAADNSAPEDSLLAPVNAMLIAEYVASIGEAWSSHVTALRFLAAGMGIVAIEQDVQLGLSDDLGLLAYADKRGLYLRADGFSGGDRKVTLTAGELPCDQLDLCPWRDQTSVEASKDCWAKLGGYAFRTYVKETEEKRRAGAGAGDIDNS